MFGSCLMNETVHTFGAVTRVADCHRSRRRALRGAVLGDINRRCRWSQGHPSRDNRIQAVNRQGACRRPVPDLLRRVPSRLRRVPGSAKSHRLVSSCRIHPCRSLMTSTDNPNWRCHGQHEQPQMIKGNRDDSRGGRWHNGAKATRAGRGALPTCNTGERRDDEPGDSSHR